MNLNEYTRRTESTAVYPSAGKRNWDELAYLSLGLMSEAGEVAGKIKKLHRDNFIKVEDVVDEVGDVFWYLARLCIALDIDPETVLQRNFLKLLDRQKRGVLGGSGDKR